MNTPNREQIEAQLAEQIEAYLTGALTEKQIEQFEEALLRHPDAAARCAEAIDTTAAVRELFRDRNEQSSELGKDPTLHGFHGLLDELANAEQSAEIVRFQPCSIEQQETDSGSLSANDFKAVAGYVFRRAVTPRRLAYAGLAAALAIAATLLIVLLPGNQPTPEHATAPTVIIRPAPAVATLTATHNAQWAGAVSAAPSPGDTLRAGQKLTLTTGFAEITTKRGAVALLEAPATIELLDNDNALHLQTGKLVGICERDSSKGFLVRTPHLEVTDLGTRFGVVVPLSGATEVHVFEGEVAVAAAAPGFNEAEPVYLTQGQSAQVDAAVSARVVRAVRAQRPRFVQDFKAVAHPPRITGEIEYRPALPPSFAPGYVESNRIQLYPEATGILLDSDFRVTLTEPGKHETFATEDAQPVGETRVDAYLVHYDFKLGDGDAGRPRNATIRFDRPILGVIADEKWLYASDRFFAQADTDFGPSVNPRDPDLPTGRGLEPQLSLPGDIVEISQDRMTLTIELYGAMAIDQLRVLVQSSDPAAQ